MNSQACPPRRLRTTLVLLSLLVTGCLVFAALESQDESNSAEDSPVVGLASVDSLQTSYDKWAETYRATNPKGPSTMLAWSRGLSSEYSKAKGIAQLDLERNLVSVRVTGLSDSGVFDVWIVENRPGEGRTVLPETGDHLVNIGELRFDGDDAWLDSTVDGLGTQVPDVVVVARRGQHPGSGGVLVGTTSLFQKKFHYQEKMSTRYAEAKQALDKKSLAGLVSGTAHASGGLTPAGFYDDLDSNLINEGRNLFFEETFGGNGRTCGTCHVEDDNMALSLTTIAKLPPDDPLFIVEQQLRADGSANPLYNDFRFEKPALMRNVGLIVENLDGFRDQDGEFTRKVVLRASSHVLSVRTTLAPPPAFSDDGTLPVDTDDLVFAERTGWSGDGTPTGFRQDFFESNGRELTGSLRDFAVGAVVQHFPLTLERSASATDQNGESRRPDFRLPTEAELDAMEAFMLSVGNQNERDDLNSIELADKVADRGRQNYLGFNVFDATPADGRPPLNCQACHFNGGANTDPTFPFPSAVTPNHDLEDLAANGGSIPSHNRSFGPAVERLADQAADVIVQASGDPSVAGDCSEDRLASVPLHPTDQPGIPSRGCSANPIDNGFGRGDVIGQGRVAANRFNSQPVFESMDNPPFFHGHQVNTIEGAVAFYATNRHFRNGDFAGAIVPLNAAQVSNVARFMRVMGADFNAQQALTLLAKANELPAGSRPVNVRLALADIRDALQLLRGAELHISDAQSMFEEATSELDDYGSPTADRNRIQSAMRTLRDAQDAMIERGDRNDANDDDKTDDAGDVEDEAKTAGGCQTSSSGSGGIFFVLVCAWWIRRRIEVRTA